jgi:hypothetical protein
MPPDNRDQIITVSPPTTTPKIAPVDVIRLQYKLTSTAGPNEAPRLWRKIFTPLLATGS